MYITVETINVEIFSVDSVTFRISVLFVQNRRLFSKPSVILNCLKSLFFDKNRQFFLSVIVLSQLIDILNVQTL